MRARRATPHAHPRDATGAAGVPTRVHAAGGLAPEFHVACVEFEVGSVSAGWHRIDSREAEVERTRDAAALAVAISAE